MTEPRKTPTRRKARRQAGPPAPVENKTQGTQPNAEKSAESPTQTSAANKSSGSDQADKPARSGRKRIRRSRSSEGSSQGQQRNERSGKSRNQSGGKHNVAGSAQRQRSRSDRNRRGGGAPLQTMQGPDLTVRLAAPKPAAKDTLRVVALGGISEIGRNMTVFETKKRLLIVDCGVLFPSSTEPGVDLILPDFAYIEDRLKDVEALVLTHGHEDHIGAIPFLLKMRPDIPVVGSRFTLALVAAKCREHRIKPKFVQVSENDSSSHGPFEVEYFAVNHSIPDALGVVIHTDAGSVMHTGDIKLDQLPMDKRPTDLPAMSRHGDHGIDLLLLDSTNATTPGVSASESIIGPTLDGLISSAKQLVIVASFASNVYRVQQVIESAVKANRKVALAGRSMVRNMEIAEELGFLEVPQGTIVDLDSAAKLPPEKLVVVTTGTQGETMAGLSRMSRREHRQINVRNGDRVILASSLVPGNEEAVFGVTNALAQIGVEVITSSDAKVHVSGHGYSGELLFIYNAVRPKNVMPVHGEWRHLRANKELAISTGVAPENVVIAQNGVVVDLKQGRLNVAGQIPVGHLYVDGLSTGDVGESALSDRVTLGEGGFIAATVVVDPRTGRLVGKPQITGKGFTDEPGALAPVNEIVENTLLDLAGQGENDPYRIAQAIRRAVGRWVANKWRRRPMIIPTVVTAGVTNND